MLMFKFLLFALCSYSSLLLVHRVLHVAWRIFDTGTGHAQLL